MELFALAWTLLTSPLLLVSTIFGTLTVYVRTKALAIPSYTAI